MSKDFGSNGLRVGLLVSQHNPDLIKSFGVSAILMKISSPAVGSPPRHFLCMVTQLIPSFPSGCSVDFHHRRRKSPRAVSRRSPVTRLGHPELHLRLARQAKHQTFQPCRRPLHLDRPSILPTQARQGWQLAHRSDKAGVRAVQPSSGRWKRLCSTGDDIPQSDTGILQVDVYCQKRVPQSRIEQDRKDAQGGAEAERGDSSTVEIDTSSISSP